MRDPKRIPHVLRMLEVYWETHPDLRLGQIILNATSRAEHPEPFYIEDEVLRDALKDMMVDELQETRREIERRGGREA
jgi:uncharacterized protein YihD (DUF1040 family)